MPLPPRKPSSSNGNLGSKPSSLAASVSSGSCRHLLLRPPAAPLTSFVSGSHHPSPSPSRFPPQIAASSPQLSRSPSSTAAAPAANRNSKRNPQIISGVFSTNNSHRRRPHPHHERPLHPTAIILAASAPCAVPSSKLTIFVNKLQAAAAPSTAARSYAAPVVFSTAPARLSPCPTTHPTISVITFPSIAAHLQLRRTKPFPSPSSSLQQQSSSSSAPAVILTISYTKILDLHASTRVRRRSKLVAPSRSLSVASIAPAVLTRLRLRLSSPDEAPSCQSKHL